jgi:hypothetical protein
MGDEMSAAAETSVHGQIEKLPGQVYRQGDMIVAPKVSDDLLAYAYLRMQNEGILPLVFYEEVPSISWFLEKYQEAGTCVLGCYRQLEDRRDLEGLSWINSVTTMGGGRYRKAEVGQAFFRKVHDPAGYAKIVIDWAFDNLKLDALFGTTPEPNKAAVQFARKLGFHMIGPLDCYATWQGELCGCWISVMTLGRWAEMQHGR